jgi:hypothetical protein
MNKVDQRFITLVRSHRKRSFLAAMKIADSISTPVLYSAATELIGRAKYLYVVDTPEKADYANQVANQITGVLSQRNEDITALDRQIREIIDMMY